MGTSTDPSQPSVDRTRLRLLGGALAAVAAAVSRPCVAAVHSPALRAIKLHNTHTGESLLTPYWEDGANLPEGLANIAHVLRDHRTDTVHPIEPALLDLLDDVAAAIDICRSLKVPLVARGGGTSQWRPDLIEDNHWIETPDREGYHFSVDLVDKGIPLKKMAVWNGMLRSVASVAGTGTE